MRELLNEKLPRYANIRFRSNNTLDRYTNYLIKKQEELMKTVSETMRVEAKEATREYEALEALVTTRIEGAIRQAGISVEPFFSNPHTGK